MPKKYSAEERWRLVALYDSGRSIDSLAEEVGITHATMRENLTRWGAKIRRRGPQRKHLLNERYFQRIYNQERAYWLGFTRAHGHVGKTGAGNRFLRVELGIQDAYHLSAMAVSLAFTGQIQYAFSKGKHGSAYLTFHSNILTDDLQQHQDLSKLEPELQPHAFRGYCDARGELLDDGAQHFYVINCDHDHQVCRQLRDWFDAGDIQKHRKTDSTYALCIDSISVIERVLVQLYTDAQVFLLRKKLEADNFLGE